MTITINGSTGISGVDGSAGTPALQGGDANTGISFGTDVVITNTGGTERSRVDSSGRLLVGTSSAPTGAISQYAKLSVVGNTSSASNGAYFTIGRGSAGSGLSLNTDIGQIIWTDNAGAEFASIGALVDGTCGANDFPGRLVFSTTADGASSPTERMRIDSSGVTRFGANQRTSITETSAPTSGTTGFVSTANTSGGLCQIFSDRISSAGTAVIGLDSDTANGIWFRTFSGGYDYRFRIANSGTATNSTGTYGTISDARVKTVIGNASSQWQDIKQLSLVKYKLNKDVDFEQSEKNTEGYMAPVFLGLVAQEVEQVCPGLVETTADPDLESIKTVKTSILYMKAVKALQEAMERIETLEAANADLATRITALEAQP